MALYTCARGRHLHMQPLPSPLPSDPAASSAPRMTSPQDRQQPPLVRWKTIAVVALSNQSGGDRRGMARARAHPGGRAGCQRW